MKCATLVVAVLRKQCKIIPALAASEQKVDLDADIDIDANAGIVGIWSFVRHQVCCYLCMLALRLSKKDYGLPLNEFKCCVYVIRTCKTFHFVRQCPKGLASRWIRSTNYKA